MKVALLISFVIAYSCVLYSVYEIPDSVISHDIWSADHNIREMLGQD